MNESNHDVEEIELFPEAPGFASSDELLASMVPAHQHLRTWLAGQIAQLDGRIRNSKPPAKPAGLTPELKQYCEAMATLDGLKAAKNAYNKAILKLDHYVRQAEEG